MGGLGAWGAPDRQEVGTSFSLGVSGRGLPGSGAPGRGAQVLRVLRLSEWVRGCCPLCLAHRLREEGLPGSGCVWVTGV